MKNSTSREQIAANVRAETARAGLDQRAIADLLGIAPSAVNERMKGRRNYSIQQLQEIAARLAIPLSRLLETHDDVPAEAAS